MSALGRGPKLDKTGNDFYATPAWCVKALSAVYTPDPGVLYEPCCGDGAIVAAWPDKKRSWWVSDIRAEAVARAVSTCPPITHQWVADCTTIPGLRDAGNLAAIISNPPFSAAPEIIKWLLDNRPEHVDVVMLLRLPWICSKKRRSWIRDCVPDIYVLSDRPSFAGSGKGNRTDSSDYGWFVWPGEPLLGPLRTDGRISHCPPRSSL